ncbi:hypothetical protein [Alloscardovia criceti]|uniref:hypothetical protein n=1 Tax=Alloscardovia criceti TaxID=356828 RepID=UPI0003733123|nr:hypothetical protein [Alloscardovia criceti]
MADDFSQTPDAPDSSDSSDSSDLSDDQVNAAFADLEKQFSDSFTSDLDQLDDNLSDHYSIDPQFDDELAGLLGNKAKIAILVTRLADAKFLAALCKVAGVDALAVGFTSGAGAILHEDEGSAPEEAAQGLSNLLAGLSIVACINRADKITMGHWLNGQQINDFSPPMMFAALDGTIEDLLIGAQSLSDLEVSGYPRVESSSFAHEEEAMDFIRSFMKNPPESDDFDNAEEN